MTTISSSKHFYFVWKQHEQYDSSCLDVVLSSKRFAPLYLSKYYMRLLFDLKKIKGTFNYKGRIRLKIKFGDIVTVTSELASFNDGSYAFLEKEVAKVQKINDQIYIEISIVAETGVVLSQITVFFKVFKEAKIIEMRNQNQVYKVYFTLSQLADGEEEGDTGLRRTSTKYEQVNQRLADQSGKLQILRLGVLMYDFAQRLDPMIYVYNKFRDLLFWENPYMTISMGILLTLIIYNLQIAIIITGLLLYFGKSWIFRKLFRLSAYKNVHNRLIVPKQNAYFLQSNMDNYNLCYQNTCAFLFNDDKTVLVNIINLLCKMGIFLVILLFFFGVEHLIVILLWTILFVTSPYRTPILKYIRPFMEFVVGQYSKIVDKVSSGLSNVLKNTNRQEYRQLTKEFYFYKYQRWWVVKGWTQEQKKFSDQDYDCRVIPREEAPQGWAWTEDWKIDFSGQVDADGYQYANDIRNEFDSNNTLATRRRRKWKRSCSKLKEQI